eukprot:GFYU01003623.1.p2 GENE.GFYU01003623.1~~GFYU01003623.1.p2  ORF type:complete len:437 (+),score=141.46 GFYU01003623.1:106-1416(+)
MIGDMNARVEYNPDIHRQDAGDDSEYDHFEPTASLWEEIKERLPAVEHEEVKKIIGTQLIEKNEELRAEVKSWMDILKDFQAMTEHAAKAIAARPKLLDSGSRSLVESEVKIFIDTLNRRMGRRNQSVENLLNTPKEKAVYEYVTKGGPAPLQPVPREHSVVAENRVLTRPGTASSNGSRGSRNHTHSSRPDSASTLSSSRSRVEGLVDVIEDQLNVLEIDHVVNDIRNVLREEEKSLLEDVEYLQRLLDEEDEVNLEVSKPPPTVSEIREFGTKLEKELTQQAEEKAMKKQMAALPDTKNVSVLSGFSKLPSRGSLSSQGSIDDMAQPPASKSGSLLGASGSGSRSGSGGVGVGVGDGGDGGDGLYGLQMELVDPELRTPSKDAMSSPVAAQATFTPTPPKEPRPPTMKRMSSSQRLRSVVQQHRDPATQAQEGQ